MLKKHRLTTKCAAVAIPGAVSLPQVFAQSPAFEVATIKPGVHDSPGRFIKMQSANRFFAMNNTLETLGQAVYKLTPRAVSGGPPRVDSDQYYIVATTPGATQPGLDEQMSMLRQLPSDRFHLTFHR